MFVALVGVVLAASTAWASPPPNGWDLTAPPAAGNSWSVYYGWSWGPFASSSPTDTAAPVATDFWLNPSGTASDVVFENFQPNDGSWSTPWPGVPDSGYDITDTASLKTGLSTAVYAGGKDAIVWANSGPASPNSTLGWYWNNWFTDAADDKTPQNVRIDYADVDASGNAVDWGYFYFAAGQSSYNNPLGWVDRPTGSDWTHGTTGLATSYSDSASTPELSSYVLLIAGALVVLGLRRRFQPQRVMA